MNLIRIIDKIKLYKAKKAGMMVGKGVMFISPLDSFGTEPYLINIGDNTMISSNVRFINHDGALHVVRNYNEKYSELRKVGKITIGSNCFVGAHSIIMPNVKIGNNCIVGIGSLVLKDIPSNTVYAGVPAKFICTLEEYIEKRIKDNTDYPRKLDKDRKKLAKFLMEHL
ncbi:acyltransferase [Anaerocolumna sp.]|jgi:acetyltransferase-like isoleucine patch superfamily enzyme|uniref:acyltransferase n=1 Tax=Anaerocolumna sp. TaxID=2041569 RepID=UPI0028A83BA1|nr:acyltransferase [Anaerocolumna sp.]